MTRNPEVKAFFDEATWTLSYVAWDPETRDAVVVDSVLEYDPAASRLGTRPVDELEQFLREGGLRLHWILDTHAHADHFTGSHELGTRFPDAKVAISERIREVQKIFGGVFNLGPGFDETGGQFDHLLSDDEALAAGSLTVRAIATPGHTPACMCFLVGDALFTGDTLFMPDYGVGRCDFPGGSAEALYESITARLYTLPDATRVFVGHDYQPGGREVLWESTIGEEKLHNVQLRASTPRESFIEYRKARDRRLGAPRLLFPSIQFNINAGRMPAPEANGTAYLKIPLRR
ncbi:MAG: MBL fold metallo-hydrolase [Betaproteobacteria bacterium]|nr:MBL fold metallo-hydrolase [Betaproteobacteria bacterium]